MGLYVDGFLIPIPKRNLGTYRRMAQGGARAWMKHGALGYYECVGDDLKNKWGVSFLRVARAKPGETVVLAWILFKSKAHRDKVNAKVMKDPMMHEAPKVIPFDVKKMGYGGFRVIVKA
jgi:uncharacterized protein YbaA (DUF1428 family)